MFEGVRGVFGFLTILLCGKNSTLEQAASSMWIFPLAGAVIGMLSGALGFLASQFLPASVSSAVALFALLLLTGFHHFDGLLDFGDALMFRGSIAERRRVMQDVSTGAGGVGLSFFVLLITYFSLSASHNLIASLMVAEASAKFSMVIAAYVGKAAHRGMGSIFVDAIKGNHRRFFLSFLIYVLITYAVAGESSAAVLLTTYASSMLLVYLSNRLLGGVSGDVFGAMNELTRMSVLLALLV